MAPIRFDADALAGSAAYDTGARRGATPAGDATGATAIGTAIGTVTGAYRGAALAPLPDALSLADAAEEISLHFTEAGEAVEFDEHQARDEDWLHLSDEDIDAYFEASKQDDGALRRELVEALLAGRPPGPRDRLSRAYPDDPSRRFLVLQTALRRAERHLAGPLESSARQAALATLDRLRDAAADLELRHGPRLRADLNTIAVAGAAGDAADVRRFQAGYRDVVLGTGTLADTLRALLGPFGAADPRAALVRLAQAVGRDLATARPSTDAVRLQALLRDQFHASTALAVLERCAGLPGTASDASSGAASPATPAVPARVTPEESRARRLMACVVAFSDERWPTAPPFVALANREGGAAAQNRIGLLTGLRAILRDLPVQVFRDGDHRERVLDAAQEALDTLIDASEA